VETAKGDCTGSQRYVKLAFAFQMGLRLNIYIRADKAVAGSSPGHSGAGKPDELEQVAGNAEDDIGDRVAGIRETELLYGEHSLLARFGPMLVTICGKPGTYKVCLWVPLTLYTC